MNEYSKSSQLQPYFNERPLSDIIHRISPSSHERTCDSNLVEDDQLTNGSLDFDPPPVRLRPQCSVYRAFKQSVAKSGRRTSTEVWLWKHDSRSGPVDSKCWFGRDSDFYKRMSTFTMNKSLAVTNTNIECNNIWDDQSHRRPRGNPHDREHSLHLLRSKHKLVEYFPINRCPAGCGRTCARNTSL